MIIYDNTFCSKSAVINNIENTVGDSVDAKASFNDYISNLIRDFDFKKYYNFNDDIFILLTDDLNKAIHNLLESDLYRILFKCNRLYDEWFDFMELICTDSLYEIVLPQVWVCSINSINNSLNCILNISFQRINKYHSYNLLPLENTIGQKVKLKEINIESHMERYTNTCQEYYNAGIEYERKILNNNLKINSDNLQRECVKFLRVCSEIISGIISPITLYNEFILQEDNYIFNKLSIIAENVDLLCKIEEQIDFFTKDCFQDIQGNIKIFKLKIGSAVFDGADNPSEFDYNLNFKNIFDYFSIDVEEILTIDLNEFETYLMILIKHCSFLVGFFSELANGEFETFLEKLNFNINLSDFVCPEFLREYFNKFVINSEISIDSYDKLLETIVFNSPWFKKSKFDLLRIINLCRFIDKKRAAIIIPLLYVFFSINIENANKKYMEVFFNEKIKKYI